MIEWIEMDHVPGMKFSPQDMKTRRRHEREYYCEEFPDIKIECGKADGYPWEMLIIIGNTRNTSFADRFVTHEGYRLTKHNAQYLFNSIGIRSIIIKSIFKMDP